MERKDRVRPVGLGFEWIGVKGGRIVEDFQFVQPFELMKHESRPETHGIPLLEVSIDVFGLFAEKTAGSIKVPVVVQVVHAYFKPVHPEPAPQLMGIFIRSFGDEIE